MLLTVDGREIVSPRDFHDLLASELDFGPYYGRNLAALWDCLSTDVERPVEVVWAHSDVSRLVLGEDVFEGIKSVLVRTMEQDQSWGLAERFTVRFE